MSNQGSSKWNSGGPYSSGHNTGETEQFQAVPQQQYGGYNQQYGQPQYGQGYNQQYQSGYQQPQKSGGGPNVWLIVVAGVLLAALVGVLAFLFGSGAFSGTSEPVTSTVVETRTQTSSSSSSSSRTTSTSPTEKTTTPKMRTYSHYAADTDVTSAGFAANVFEAFQDAYGRTGSTDVTIKAYSPAVGTDFTMTCSGGATVYCSGGNNARVRIW